MVPDEIPAGKVVVDKAYIDKRLGNLVRNRDLSHFIL
jgi:ATP-dependent protease HslVU (ClpYQ) ATPase subunit